jgi:ankyrin repeat protein
MDVTQEINKLELFSALKQKSYPDISRIISSNPSLAQTALGPEALTPLEMAAQLDDIGLVSFFMTDMNDERLWRAMVMAVSCGSKSVCDVLFKLPSAEKYFKFRDQSGKKLIHYAAIHGHNEILLELKNLGCYLNDPIDCSGSADHGKNPLHLSMENNHPNCALWLYKNGYKHLNYIKDNVKHFIHFAAMKGYLPLVLAYAEDSGDLNLEDVIGQTPLLWAASTGQTEVVAYLLSQKVKVDSSRSGELSYRFAPIFWAVLNGHTEVVRQLLDAKAKFDMLCWTYGNPEESWGVPYRLSFNSFYIVGVGALSLVGLVSPWLILPGMILDLSKCNNKKLTLLHIAAQEGYLEIVCLLLRHSSYSFDWKNQRNVKGKTAKDLAEAAGHYVVVRALESNLEFNELSASNRRLIDRKESIYKSHHINQYPSFYQSQGRCYTAQTVYGKRSRSFGNVLGEKLIVEFYESTEGAFGAQSAELMKLAYPGEYQTFYIPGHLSTKSKQTIRFIRPFFEGESAHQYLQNINDVDELLLIWRAIAKELVGIHKKGIFLNQMHLNQILIKKTGDTYHVIFLDFSKSTKEQSLKERLGFFCEYPDFVDADVRLYAKMLYQFLYEHPQCVSFIKKTPSLMELILSCSSEEKSIHIESQFKNLLSSTISSDWQECSEQACELTPLSPGNRG